jgi:hypothetical protein
MHGVGTFEASNGSRYQGGWLLGKKQGLGKQTFSTGDTYEVNKQLKTRILNPVKFVNKE